MFDRILDRSFAALQRCDGGQQIGLAAGRLVGL